LVDKTFYIVDVFAEEKYAGNPLAVVRDADDLSIDIMQRIAREMNYSETTFIFSNYRYDEGYMVRIFTPEREVPFAGHPSIGTAYIIQHEIIRKPIETLYLNLKIGRIPIYINYIEGKIDILWMEQKQPTFGRKIDRRIISKVLGLDKEELDGRYPIQEVSTGLPFIIVPIKNLEAVRSIEIDKRLYFRLIKDLEAKAILVFSPETYDKANHLNVRVFADYYGVPEDPATGSANGCLAGYLVKYRYFDDEKIDIRVEQGYEIGRKSLLYLKASREKNSIKVYVGGRVQMIAKGLLI